VGIEKGKETGKGKGRGTVSRIGQVSTGAPVGKERVRNELEVNCEEKGRKKITRR
jgi:hypothetical protein